MKKTKCPKCKGKGCSHCGGKGYHMGMSEGGDTGKKKNKPAVTKKMQTKQRAGFSLASSPRFKTIAAKVDKGELTTSEALDILIPKDLKGEERTKARKKLAQALGSQNAEAYTTKSRQRINEELNRKGGEYEKKQSRKPGMSKGGDMGKKNPNAGIAALRKVAPKAVKRMGFKHGGMANCGASMKPTQKSNRGR